MATLTVASSASFRAPSGVVKVESELILYQTNAQTTTLTLCRRGWGSTTAASHSDLVTVSQCDLSFVYLKRPTALAADADIPQIDAGYHEYLVLKAAAETLKIDGRLAEADRFQAEWDRKLREAKGAIRKRQAASPYHIGTDY